MKTIVILLFAVIATTTSLDLPSNFKICKRSDPKLNECLLEAVKIAVVAMADGIKSFKIMPLEPLAIDKIKVDESGNSVVFKQEYKNIKIYGLTKQLEIKKFEINFDKLIFHAEALNSQVNLYADYKFDGKILLLPVQGEGKCNITIYDLTTKHEIYFEQFQKNGETYAKVKKYDIKLLPKRTMFYFSNLFNNDNILGEEINKVFNDNDDLIFQELSKPFEKTFNLVFSKTADNIFTRVPFNKII